MLELQYLVEAVAVVVITMLELQYLVEAVAV
jgi:hypothetical protein